MTGMRIKRQWQKSSSWSLKIFIQPLVQLQRMYILWRIKMWHEVTKSLWLDFLFKKKKTLQSSKLEAPTVSRLDNYSHIIMKHALLVTVSRGSNSLRHWSSINDSHSWIINISDSLALFLSEQVSLSSSTLPSSINSPDSRMVSHTIHSISFFFNTNLFTSIQRMFTNPL